MRKRFHLALASGLTAALVIGCGSGSDAVTAADGGTTNPPVAADSTPVDKGPVVTGTVAIGAPLVNAEIDFRCRTGSAVRTNSDSNGRFSANLRGSGLPCVARATRRAGAAAASPVFPDELVSIVLDTGSSNALANITPLTHMVVAHVFARDPAAVFGDPTMLAGRTIAASDVRGAQAQIEEDLRIRIGVLLPAPCQDWLSSEFIAQRGDAIDDSLETLAERLQQSAKPFAELVAETAASRPATATGSNAACPI